jgi:predicted RNA-binding protein with PUA-like domain
MQYWLVKQEPEDYSWADFVKDGRSAWTGVRNYQARNNLRAMSKGDLVFYYHSGEEKQVVGIAKVDKPAYPDSTAKEGDWSSIDLVPVKPVVQPVTLKEMKSDSVLKEMLLVRNSRLSVVPVSKAQFEKLLKLSKTSV